VDCRFPFSECDAMVFEIVLSSSPGALAATQRHASKQWKISKCSG
jgi:hypothetical protein